MTSEEFAQRSIELFNEYSEWMGVGDEPFISEDPLALQLEYVDKFKSLVCEHTGHDVVSDDEGGEDWCQKCHRLASKIAASEGRLDALAELVRRS